MLKIGRQKKHDVQTARPSAGSISDQDLLMICKLLYQETGIVLTENKRSLIEARLRRRLRALNLHDFEQYITMIREDTQGSELIHLIDAISTNVTRFFREDDHFQLIDKLMTQWTSDGSRRFRFWSAACSSGEEPYSLAMTLAPHLRRHDLDVKILGTDISTKVLEQAVKGEYSGNELESLPGKLRSTFFHQLSKESTEIWAIDPALKNLMMFRRLNFTRFPYAIRGVFDVIFCRNAMIYFDNALRGRMVSEFFRLLKPGGFLLIGHSETLIGVDEQFIRVQPSVYRRRNPGEDK